MKISKSDLRRKIIESLKSQGFNVNPHLNIERVDKGTLKQVHEQKRKEQIQKHKKFLIKCYNKVEKHSISGKDIEPVKINLKLIEVKHRTLENQIFFWWNLIWWSIPYTKPIGRQMRFIIWDDYHDAPFGLFLLQSPTLKSKVRDNYLNLDNKKVDYWINQSLYGQRIGALPPYNELLGAKLVAMSMTSNEVRNSYERKYNDRITELNKRILPNRLLFITTTSAYGKSSVYERIKYKNENVSKFIGFTKGAGTFHIPEFLFKECLKFLEQESINIKRGYGTGSSRKLKLISKALNLLNLPNFQYHSIKRGFYLFSNVKNLHEIIQEDEEPIYYNRPFKEVEKYWKERWCLPRSKRINRWKTFNCEMFFNEFLTNFND